MEMAIIVIVALIAFAVVLVPLMRRDNRGGDTREFDMGEPAAHTQDGEEPVLAPMAAGPVSPMVHVESEPHDTPPLFALHDAADVEREVQRYRVAVRAGTVCRKCGQANPADSLFCFECGKPLQRADAKEFE